MAAERADQGDRVLHLAQLMSGESPDGYPQREALDDSVMAPEEV